MKFVQVLLDGAGEARRRLIVATVVAGAAMGSVMAVVNTVTDRSKESTVQWELLGLFVLGCATFLFAKSYALNLTTQIVEDLLYRIRVRFSDKIRRLDLSAYERIGRSRISTAMTRDVQTLSEAGTMIVHGASSAVMLIFSTLYVAYLSLVAFAITLVLFGTAIYFYKRSQESSAELWRRATEAENGFNQGLGHLLGGFKEVKMNSQRGDDLLLGNIAIRSREAEALKIQSGRRFNAGANVTNLFFYLLMGTMVFALPQNVESAGIAAKVINVIIFVGSAIEIVLKALPMLAKSNMALAELDALEGELDQALERPEAAAQSLTPSVRRIELKGVTYSYFDRDGKALFTVGPCDLAVEAGGIYFIVGGNGSGKSTLVKLLTRLYEPQTGEILWDGQPVAISNVAEYRNLFSTIFADFHLFDRLYGMSGVAAEKVQALLDEMALSGKTKFEGQRFTTLDLSTGQRKRLAMVVALLEDRPVYVFDEWAADQDPEFRKRFYEEELPRLKADGRTVIVVTHDDRYFHVADTVVYMEEGRILRVGERA